MSENEEFSKQHIRPDAFENTKNRPQSNKISSLVNSIHSADVLHLIGVVMQVFLGLVVTTIAILGFIQPFWLSTLVSIAASVTTIVGIYGCYSALSAFNKETLLRDAMRRIVEDQN